MDFGSFSHRRTCSIRLFWMGFRCSPVKGSPCSTSSTKRSLAGTFLGYGLFQNSEKGGFCRGCSGGRGRNRDSSIQELEDSRTQEAEKVREVWSSKWSDRCSDEFPAHAGLTNTGVLSLPSTAFVS